MNTSDFKRFVSKFTPGTRDECWEWTAATVRGYGVMGIGPPSRKATKKAHRLSYEHFTGRSLGKLLCCHTCDNPSCVNPNHLFAGTHQDNVDDMIRKGRKAIVIEPANKLLTDHERDLIRRFPRHHKMFEFLGRWFGLSAQQVRSIRYTA